MITIHDIGVVLVTIGVACIFAAAWHWAAEVFESTPRVPPYPHNDDFWGL